MRCEKCKEQIIKTMGIEGVKSHCKCTSDAYRNKYQDITLKEIETRIAAIEERIKTIEVIQKVFNQRL